MAIPDSITVDGKDYPLDYTRRRYGKTTYTWVHVEIDGDIDYPLYRG